MAEKNFEQKMIELSSHEALKDAKLLLKNNALSCAYRDEQNQIVADFENRNSRISTVVKTGEAASAHCDCSNDSEKLCQHAVAAIMYSSRFNQHIKPIDDEIPLYSGMKHEALLKLANNKTNSLTATLSITVNSEFPHVPSKWENAVLNVKLRSGDREYLGNMNNLRQLYFDKLLAVSLKLESFSLQDQQIIRYLAINGEADSSNILLNSEQTAEFFHCLIGFERFCKDGRRLIIHPEYAEAVILKKTAGHNVILSPAIRVSGAILDLGLAKVITGRAGCWVGRQGEYYFVPAKLDVSWIRNFFRSGRQEVPEKIPESLTFNGDFPVPIVTVNFFELEKLEHLIFLRGSLDSRQRFHLQTNYIYKDRYFPANSGRLAIIGERFYRRDEEAERNFESELSMFGFEKVQDELILDNQESIGIFLDRVIPLWMLNKNNLVLDANLSRLCCGGNGLNESQMRCKLIENTNGFFRLHYQLSGGQSTLKFNDLLKLATENRRYGFAGANGLVRLGDDFRKFLLASTNIIENLDEKNHTFEIPFFSADYYRSIAGNIPGAVPNELTGVIPNTQISANSASDSKNFEFKGSLRPYQNDGVNFLYRMTSNNFNVILADEMGLGKTIQILALLAKMQRKKDNPSLVVCPASLLTNWEREANKFVPDFKVAQISGTHRSEIWDEIKSYDLVILSYAICRHDADKIRNLEFNYLILDEAQHIKNPGTGNAVNCKAIRAKHRLVLTGTPLENSSEDLWSIFDFLHHGMLGSFASFKHYYSRIHEDKDLQQDLALRVSPFIKRRTKAQVAQELPPKQEITLFCDMDAEQRLLYEDTLNNGRMMLNNLSKSATPVMNTEIFTTLLRLRQICCHPNLLPNFDNENFPSAKMDLLHELLLEDLDSNHKVLLFSQFTSVLAIIEKWMKAEKIKYEYLDGATRNRQQHVDNFNNDDSIKVFLLSLKAGGTGLNLTSADTVIIYDPWWNPAVELQAADRTHRIGQTRPVNSIKLLVKNSIEEKILQLQEKKQQIFDSVIDNPTNFSEKLSIDELKFLLN